MRTLDNPFGDFLGDTFRGCIGVTGRSRWILETPKQNEGIMVERGTGTEPWEKQSSGFRDSVSTRASQ